MTIIFFLYFLAVAIVDLLLLPLLLAVGLARRVLWHEPWRNIGERLALIGNWPANQRQQRVVWFHAPSLGEGLSALPLLASLANAGGKKKSIFFFITCQSPSARGALDTALAQYLPRGQWLLTCHPFDNYWLYAYLWRQLRPRLFLLVESDFLPRRALWLRRYGITAWLINGRLSHKTKNFFTFCYHWGRLIFGGFDVITAQSSAMQKLLTPLSQRSVALLGNLKRVKKHAPPNQQLLSFYRRLIGRRRPLVFSCCHSGEEKVVLDLHRLNPTLRDDFFTIVVPRHPAETRWRGSFTAAANRIGLHQDHLFTVSLFGHLPSLYHLSPLVLLGGSWLKRGGHNPGEALEKGALVIHGPCIDNDQEFYHQARRRNLTHLATDSAAIKKTLDWFYRLPPARRRQLKTAAQHIGKEQGQGIMARYRTLLVPRWKKIMEQP